MKKYIPLIIIVCLMLVVYFLGFFDSLNFETLKANHHKLTGFVESYPMISPFVFMGIYFLTVLLSILGAIFLTLIGGFLFDQPFATLYVIIGASLGASGIFVAARTALGEILKKKAGPRLKKMEKGFKKNATSYLLFLRFVPIFPFWLVNLAPAFFDVPFVTFFWTTVVGIAPGSFVFVQAGKGLASIFEQDTFSLNAIFNLHVKIALVGLGVIALIPIVIKKLRKKKHD